MLLASHCIKNLWGYKISSLYSMQGHRKLTRGGAADRSERWHWQRQRDGGVYCWSFRMKCVRKSFRLHFRFSGWALVTLLNFEDYRKHRFQTICSHRSLALSLWPGTDSRDEYITITITQEYKGRRRELTKSSCPKVTMWLMFTTCTDLRPCTRLDHSKVLVRHGTRE